MKDPLDRQFRTLTDAVHISGIGLHNGCAVQVCLRPTQTLGIVFVRTDLDHREIPASHQSVKSTFHATVLAHEDADVSTPEHLLAALWGMGITHCRIEISGAEVPILDGSAEPWRVLLESAGSVTVGVGERPLWQLKEPLRVEDHGAMMLAVPYSGLRFTVAVDFEVPYLPPQLLDLEMAQSTFNTQLAPARTFTLEQWIEPLREKGLIRGGSTDNALVLSEHSPSSELRFPDELARHKTLDALGDLSLLTASEGAILHAHFILIRAGHALHYQWMEAAIKKNSIKK